MSTNGTTFKIVVINCNLPEVKIPNEFTQVKIQIVTRPAITATNGLVAKIGMNALNALIKETAIAALVNHTETK